MMYYRVGNVFRCDLSLFNLDRICLTHGGNPIHTLANNWRSNGTWSYKKIWAVWYRHWLGYPFFIHFNIKIVSGLDSLVRQHGGNVSGIFDLSERFVTARKISCIPLLLNLSDLLGLSANVPLPLSKCSIS